MSLNVITFSDVCGENVELSDDNKVATWTPKTSGGWACSEQEFKPGETIEVKVEGSGRCDIGFMKGEQSPRSFKTLNEIRAHRKTCNIRVTFNETGEEISSSFEEKTFKRRIEKGTKIWISILIRYGSMSVEISSGEPSQQRQKFSSDKHGPNILLESDNTHASSVSKSPASVCFISEKLQIGSTLYLQAVSEKEGGREVGRYELKLQVSKNSPEDLKKDCRYLFEASEPRTGDPALTMVETFEKDDLKGGNVSLTLTDNKAIQYKTAKGKQNTQALSFDVENGVWIVLSLYGVCLRVTPTDADEPRSDQQGVDQLDSVFEPPRRPVTVVQPDQTLSEDFGSMTMQPIAFPINQGPSQDSSNMAGAGVCGNETGEKLNLQINYPMLVREIETLEFCDHLYARNIVTHGQMDEIHAMHKSSGRVIANRELIKMMKSKKIIKSVMDEILADIGQSHLLEKFYPKEDTHTSNKY